MEFKDYYATLGVDKDADASEIQKAYRKLARKYHPDVNKEPEAEARFKEIGEAYEVLKDPGKRKKYDRFGTDWNQAGQGSSGPPPPGWENVVFDFGEGFGGGGRGFRFEGGEGFGASGFSSFFDALFGGGMGGAGMGGPATGRPGGARRAGAGGPSRGGDAEAEIRLGLEEAARGGRREITLSDPAGGTQRIAVTLPKGVRPGQRIRLAGKGTPGAAGGPAGDLYLKVQVAPHPRFRLHGKDLHTTLRVAPWEAALGGEAEVPTLNGPVRVKIPAGTSSGRKIRLRGQGFPAKGGAAGDLLAEVAVVVPEEPTEKERELYQKLAEVSEFRPRER